MAKFKPGQSGNPGGRPKALVAVRELARAHTESAVKTLFDIMTQKKAPAAARVSAAQVLLDRGWGKVPQQLEYPGPDGELIRVSDTELARRLVFILSKAIEMPVVEELESVRLPEIATDAG